MKVIEIHAGEMNGWPFEMDEILEMAFDADRRRTPEQREHVKQHLLDESGVPDRLMQGQQVCLFMIGGFGQYLTPWGARPASGDAFESAAVDALLDAGKNDPFLVYALSLEVGRRVNEQALLNAGSHHQSGDVSGRRYFTLQEAAGVIADATAVLKVTWRISQGKIAGMNAFYAR